MLTTLVAQLASAFTFGVGGPWIKADLWQRFPRPAPTQEMAVTGECSLGRGDYRCASQRPRPQVHGPDPPLNRSFGPVTCPEGTASLHVPEQPSDLPGPRNRDSPSVRTSAVPPGVRDRKRAVKAVPRSGCRKRFVPLPCI